MNTRDEILEFIYEDKKAFNKTIGLLVMYYSLLLITLNINSKIVYGIVSIFMVILTFSVILITLSTKNMYNDSYFISLLYGNIYVVVISLISFFTFEVNIQYINSVYHNSILQFVYYILLVIPVNYINNNDSEKIFSKIIVRIVSVIYFTIIILDKNGDLIILINLIPLLIIGLYLWLIRRQDFIIDKRINYFRISMTVLFIKSLVYNILFYMGVEANQGGFAVIFSFSYGILTGGVINKLINDPYKILFAEVYQENMKLQEINNTIIEKNKELEKSQEKIKIRERIFQLFLSEVPISILIVNTTNNRIIFANKSFLKLFKYKAIKDVVNRKLQSIITINNKENYICNSELSYSGQATINGNMKYLEIQTILPKDNDFERVLLVYDSSIKRNIENVKKKLDKELLEEKIKREFLSNITHDLKTPINVIYSAMQVEKFFVEKKNSSELGKYNSVCKQNCKGLIALTDNLIDSGKVKTNYMEPSLNKINLVEIVERNIVALIDYAKIQNIDMIFDTNREKIYCMLDEEFINRIMTNLISNAIKFTNEGGEIRVSVEQIEDRVRVQIKDTGIGMEPYFVKVAFERYSMDMSNKYNDKGSGIGLFVVRKLIEIQGGDICINSKVGLGTNVIINFNVL